MPGLRRTAITAVGALAVMAPAAVSAPVPARPAGITASDTPTTTARAYLAQHRARAGVTDPAQMSVAGTQSGVDGTTVVRLQQEVDGVPVLGGEAVVVVDAARRVLAADGATLADPPASVAPAVTARAARTAALAAARKSLGTGLTTTTPTLVVADPALLGGPGLPAAGPAWDLRVSKGPMVRRRVLVDATTGTVITMLDDIKSAKSLAVCNALFDAAAWPCTAPFVRVDSATPSGTAEVDSAYDLAGATYDFYAALGRDSIDNAGMRILSTVNFCPAACPTPSSYYQNAFWEGSQMVYGPGFASADDVVAHELTHGVTERSSNLVYWYQSGAINEGLSDIMGELFDLQRNPTPPSPWKIAEDSPLGVIRDMANPPAYGDPDRMGSPNYAMGSGDNGGVHTNSGVANKTAYLIADGGTFNGQVVAGIGRTKSAVLWYQVDLALRMSSDYSDLADTLDATCSSLAGLGTSGFTAGDCAEVAKATTATEMRVDPLTVPTACTAGKTAVSLFDDGFDTGVATNWVTAASIGANQWYASSATSPDGNTMHWPTDAAANARGVDAAVPSDSTMTMRTGIVMPATAYLRVNHWYQFEASQNALGVMQGYDGGVIEYSTNNGGTWTDVSGLSTVNGYSGTINADRVSDNPLEGRAGFVTTSNGATTTQVSLSTLAGQTVKFRFRVASDTGTSGYGWYIDSVAINNCVSAPSAATVTGITPGDQSLSVAFTLGADGGTTPSNVEYSTDDGGSWTPRSPASITSPLSISGLTNGTGYPVRVRVVGPGGTSGQSNAITSTPVAPLSRSVTITSTEAASYAIDGVAPIVAASASAGTDAVTYASSTTSVCTVDAASGQVAFTGTGTCSITGAVGVSGSYQAATSTPTSFTVLPAAPVISAISGGDGSLSVAFTLGTVGGVAPTNVEYSTNGGGAWTPRSPASTASPLTITGLANGTDYPVRIRVVAAAGTGGQSNAITGAPVAPVARTISITSSQASSYALDAAAPVITASPSLVGGQVTFASSTPAVCTVHTTSGQVAFTGAGTCSITASVAASGALVAATSSPTTFAVVGPASAPAPAPAPTPTGNPLIDTAVPSATGSTAGATVTPVPATPRWTPVTAGATAASTFVAKPRTTYAVKATRQGAPGAKGTCRVTAGTATCRVRLARAGTWTVVVTPTTAGKAGKPMRSVVKVTAPKR